MQTLEEVPQELGATFCNLIGAFVDMGWTATEAVQLHRQHYGLRQLRPDIVQRTAEVLRKAGVLAFHIPQVLRHEPQVIHTEATFISSFLRLALRA